MLINILDNDIKIIIREIVKSMTINVCVKSVEVISENKFKIYTCNTQHLRACSRFSVDNIDYVVDEFVQDEYLIIEGIKVIEDCFTLTAPYFLSGTPVLSSTELIQLKTDLDRFPFIWLPQVYSTEYVNEKFNDYSKSRVVVCVFDTCDQVNKFWLDRDHEKGVIRPMKRLCDNFLQSLNKDNRTMNISSLKSYDRADFGKYKDKKGNIESILPESLSGVELSFEISIFADNNCKNKC